LVREFLDGVASHLGVVSEETLLSTIEPNILRFVESDVAFWRDNGFALLDAIRELRCFGLVSFPGVSRQFVARQGLYFDTAFIADMIPLNDALGQMTKDAEDYPELLYEAFRYAKAVEHFSALTLADVDIPLVIFYPQLVIPGSDTLALAHPDPKVNVWLRNLSTVGRTGASAFILHVLGLKGKAESEQEVAELVSSTPALQMNGQMRADDLAVILDDLSQKDSQGWAFGVDPDAELQWRVSKRRILDEDRRRLLNSALNSYTILAASEAAAAMTGATSCLSPSLWLANSFRYTAIEREWGVDSTSLPDERTLFARSFEQRFPWLQCATSDDLIKVREKGMLDELRNIFRDAYEKLRLSGVKDFEQASANLEAEVVRATEEYSAEVIAKKAERQGDLKLAGMSVAANAGLMLTALLFPHSPVAQHGTSAIGFLGGFPSLTDFVIEYFEGKKELANLAGRPISVLLDIRERSKKEEVGRP
jgi:hypothetical protein